MPRKTERAPVHADAQALASMRPGQECPGKQRLGKRRTYDLTVLQ